MKPMRPLPEIKAELEILKPSLQQRFKVETIDIFGSYARNDANENSDIDLLVTYSTTDYDYFTIIGLKNYLRKN
jgi:predicted nucleotidyltransferase